MASLDKLTDVSHFLENHFNLQIKTFQPLFLKFEFSFTFEHQQNHLSSKPVRLVKQQKMFLICFFDESFYGNEHSC